MEEGDQRIQNLKTEDLLQVVPRNQALINILEPTQTESIEEVEPLEITSPVVMNDSQKLGEIKGAGKTPLIKLDAKPLHQLCDSPYEDENNFNFSSNRKHEDVNDDDEFQVKSDSDGVNKVVESSKIL